MLAEKQAKDKMDFPISKMGQRKNGLSHIKDGTKDKMDCPISKMGQR